MLGLYVHIPFCVRKCGYCDFASTDCWGSEELYAYVRALGHEIKWRSQETGTRLSSLYVGGGTPTVLPPALWEELWGHIHRHYQLEEDGEVTVEANPGTLDNTGLAHLRSLGVNRLSLGVQSFADRELQAMGRIHTADQARDIVEAAHQAGFSNLSIDLMTGVPCQDRNSFARSLEQAVTLPLTHISVYELLVEPGTAYSRKQQEGTLLLPPDPEMEAIDSLKGQILEASGFERYEISNYARPGYHSRHNTLYWKNGLYTGVGLSAVSREPGKRTTNTGNMVEYMEALQSGNRPAFQEEPVDREMALEEEIFLGLRLREGITARGLQERFGIDLFEKYGVVIREMKSLGFLEADDQGIRLTKKGMDWSNRVMTAFMR